MPAETLHFDWEWDPLDLLHMPQKEISIELQRLREFGIHRPVLTDLQYMSSEQQRGAWYSLSHMFHYIGNAILILLVVLVSSWILYRCCLWRRSKRRDRLSNEQPRLQRALDDAIRNDANARIMGSNTPFLHSGPPPVYANHPPHPPASAPTGTNAATYNAATDSVQLNTAQPYSDAHLAVRSEYERQQLLKHMKNQVASLKAAPLIPDEQ
jgi:hypothetical protein